LSRDVAKEEWKETLSMLPRDTYTPMVTFEAVVSSQGKSIKVAGEKLTKVSHLAVNRSAQLVRLQDDFARGFLPDTFSEHLGVPHDKLSDPWSFPIFAKSFDNFPRTYIQCAGLDPLGPEGVLFEKVLREHGVETKIDYYPVIRSSQLSINLSSC
jgi:acetyl esterase/lipase